MRTCFKFTSMSPGFSKDQWSCHNNSSIHVIRKKLQFLMPSAGSELPKLPTVCENRPPLPCGLSHTHMVRMLHGALTLTCLQRMELVIDFRPRTEGLHLQILGGFLMNMWYSRRKALQKEIRMAKKSTGSSLPSLEGISRCLCRAGKSFRTVHMHVFFV